ncbi:isoprenylcysteine carboxyl methyltransferase family protein [Nonomuraea sp. NPDC049709]|uniref:isoprenylcysteine carboxyl methyltransferase family protein n=1 Tax=Nonomuraea sp. NPDC049709 TaxID=3154736 RepID=UPI00342CE623
MTAYALLIGLVVLERLAELVVARRNLAWARSRGGVEYGRRHYPWIVLAHVALLVTAPAEVWLLGRPFVPALGWPMLAVVALAQGLRWWCVATLGRQWNTRVVVVPGMPLVRRGPYRWLRHPNYVAVVAEGIALPLVHTAWLTALAFTVANAVLLVVRIRVEDRALALIGPDPAGRP